MPKKKEKDPARLDFNHVPASQELLSVTSHLALIHHQLPLAFPQKSACGIPLPPASMLSIASLIQVPRFLPHHLLVKA